jgi:3-oxoacyl-[acyl-carrier-protein] synthase-3
MKRTKIISTGSYLPEKVLTNFDLEKIVDTTDEWITTRTGIKERHLAAENEATSDLVIEAAKIALKKANLEAKDLDGIIVATITPDNAYPSTACWVEKGLGIKGIPVFDVSAACTGFLYALTIADSLIKSGVMKRILVAGAETLTKFTNWEDRSTCVLFGDGAGVVIVEESDDESGILSTFWGADGNLGELLIQPAGGSKMPPTEETVKNKLHTVHMEGNKVFRWAVRHMQEAAEKALEKAGLTGEDIDLFIPHQANLRIIDQTVKYAKIDPEKTYIVIDKIANISAGTIPIALDMAVNEGRIEKGDILLFAAFGGGFTWGAATLRW